MPHPRALDAALARAESEIDDDTYVEPARAVPDVLRLSPDRLATLPVIPFPAGVSRLTGIPAATLDDLRARGNAPRLSALGRRLFVLRDDFIDWLRANEIAPGARLREPAGVSAHRSAR